MSVCEHNFGNQEHNLGILVYKFCKISSTASSIICYLSAHNPPMPAREGWGEGGGGVATNSNDFLAICLHSVALSEYISLKNIAEGGRKVCFNVSRSVCKNFFRILNVVISSYISTNQGRLNSQRQTLYNSSLTLY